MSRQSQSTPKFSTDTIAFLKKAARQKRGDWLEKNQAEYDSVLREPLTHLAETVIRELSPLAPDYHFPKRGLGRLKRSANRVAEQGVSLYKNWLSYSAARPRVSRFEHHPNLFFLINSEDAKDPVLVAGGLYMPSSQQTRKIREAIAHDASAFDLLFESKDFSKRFPGGFSKEKTSTRPPRGFDPNHERLDWLKLQAFFVWKPYSKKEYASAGFAKLVAEDFKQILRLNRLLEKVVIGKGLAAPKKARRSTSLLENLESIEASRRPMDF